MNRTIVDTIIAVLCFIAGLFLCQKCYPPKAEIEIRERVDTLFVYDTVKITEPVIVDRVIKDTMFVEVPTEDIVVVHDTTYVQLPREYVTYKDSMYRAVVSGYIPRLEEIEIYPKKEIITIQTEKVITVPKPTRFGIGVQAGYGVTPKGFQPYVGVGISYNILAF